MLGVPCRIHDLTGDDLGIVHLPPPVEPGDLVLLEHRELRVVDVVELDQTYPVAAIVKVQAVHLPVIAAR